MCKWSVSSGNCGDESQRQLGQKRAKRLKRTLQEVTSDTAEVGNLATSISAYYTGNDQRDVAACTVQRHSALQAKETIKAQFDIYETYTDAQKTLTPSSTQADQDIRNQMRLSLSGFMKSADERTQNASSATAPSASNVINHASIVPVRRGPPLPRPYFADNGDGNVDVDDDDDNVDDEVDGDDCDSRAED